MRLIASGGPVVLAWACLLPATAEEPERLSITHGPVLVSPRADGVTVLWHTNRRCVSHVEYGTGETLDRKAVSAHHGLIDANDTVHAVSLAGLAPGARVRYRVVSREIVKQAAYKVDFGGTVTSEAASFRVLDPAKGAFSFVAVSDVHEKAARLDGMLKAVDWKDVDLAFLNGDILSHFEREEQVGAGFLDVCAARFARTIPYVHVRGNHETRGPSARQLSRHVPTTEGRFYGSFSHGGVRFVVMDSGEDKPDSDKEYFGLVAFDPYRREQAEWLKGEIRTDGWRKAAFRVAVFHMPTFGGNSWHGEQQIRELWNPLLNEGGVDLALCGHTHQLAHLPPAEGANRYPIVIGSTESVTRVDVAGKGLAVRVTGPEGRELAGFRLESRTAPGDAR